MSRLSRLTQSFSNPNMKNNTNEAKNTVVQKNLELDFEINEAVLNIEQLKVNEFNKTKRVPFITVSLKHLYLEPQLTLGFSCRFEQFARASFRPQLD